MTSLTDYADSKDQRECSCHPDDAITPCPKQHALWHCQHEAVLRGTHKIAPADSVDKRIEAERKLIADWLRNAMELISDGELIEVELAKSMAYFIERGEYRKETGE